MRWRCALGSTFVAVTTATLLFHGCSAPDAVPSDSGPTGVYDPDAHSTAQSSDAGATGEASSPIPSIDTTGWIPFPDYAPTCGFYVPASAANMPPPLAWEACEPGLVPTGVICRKVRVDWAGTLWVLPESAYVQSSGVVTLQFNRFLGTSTSTLGIQRVVADVDGPVRQAILETQPTCTAPLGRVHGGRVVWEVVDSFKGGKLGASSGGAIGGDLGQPLRVLLHDPQDPEKHWGYYPGPTNFVADGTSRVAHPWADASVGVAIPTWGSPMFYRGEDFFANGTSSEDVYTPDAGVQHLLGFPGDSTRAVYDFATDGVDMFWHEASGIASSSSPPTAMDSWTAPYTTTPAAIARRRLRSEFPGFASGAAVGCGYAASNIFDPAVGWGERILRLSDGVSWHFALPSGARWQWQQALAVTCDEVFMLAADGPNKQVVRVRIESLVNPEPPD